MPRRFALASIAAPRAMSESDRPRCQKRLVSSSLSRPGLSPATIWPSSACRFFSESRPLSTCARSAPYGPGFRLAPVVHDDLVHDVGERELDGAHRAVGNDAGALLDPRRLQLRLGLFEPRRLDDDVGAAHARLPVLGDDDVRAGQVGTQARAERVAAFLPARMDADLVEREDRMEQAHVPVRRAARADVAEHLRVAPRQRARADRGDGSRAHVGDVARVDDGDRHAGGRVEQVEQRQLGRQADLVVAIEVADHLDARHGERPDVAAQDVEVTRAVLLWLQVHARLDRRLAAALRDQALLDRRDDLGVAQRQRLDVGMVEVVEMDLAGGAGRGGGHVSRPASAASGPARVRTPWRSRSRRRRGA